MKNRIIYLLIFILSCSLVFARKKVQHIVILHTNDTHSQVEPNKNDLGGYARRLGEINQIRSKEKNVVLLDAGDFSQGTPYYNFFSGRVEIEAMNKMRYDSSTLGNHEFDNGMDSLAMVMKLAKFPFVISNYEGSNSPLKGLYKPYVILKKGGVKIGIFGIGVKPEGLIFKKNYEGITYQHPVNKAIEISNHLRETKKCDIIVCLSHLGIEPMEGNFIDYDLAKASTNIDIIIGGHSHSILVNNTENNANGKPVIVAQMGKSGLNLGRIDLELEKK